MDTAQSTRAYLLKWFLPSLLLLFLAAGASAQVIFSDQISVEILEGMGEYESIDFSDLDGDDDLDIFTATSTLTHGFCWYENMDGHGTYSEFWNNIATSTWGAPRVIVGCDLNGDGHDDALLGTESGGFEDDYEVLWMENSGPPLYNLGPVHFISSETLGVTSLASADLDGDGDLDVLSASFSDDKIAWYENLDGLGNFGNYQQRVITITADGAKEVEAADLDGDGDQDVLFASLNDEILGWFENLDGLGNFGPEQFISHFSEELPIVVCDMDGDGDNDILYSTSQVGRIDWYENVNGLGDFSQQHVVEPLHVGEITGISNADLDLDGDFDVLAATLWDEVLWYENIDGMGNFSPEQLVSTDSGFYTGVFCADLDSDGDNDVITTSFFGHELSWYRNETLAPPGSLELTGITTDIPAEGGTLSFDAHFTYDHDDTLTNVEYWSFVVTQGGYNRGPIILQDFIAVPGIDVTVSFEHQIPAGFPAGTYVYRGVVGNYPDGILRDTFAFTKAGDRTEQAVERVWDLGDWTTRGGFDELDDSLIAEMGDLPSSYELESVYPNPFNPATTIEIGLALPAELQLTVYNMLGQEVAMLCSETHPAGFHSFTFDGSSHASGIYFVHAHVPGELNEVRKIVLMK